MKKYMYWSEKKNERITILDYTNVFERSILERERKHAMSAPDVKYRKTPSIPTKHTAVQGRPKRNDLVNKIITVKRLGKSSIRPVCSIPTTRASLR